MNGLQHFHRLGEASNYRSPFDWLRANGSLRLSTAIFKLMVSNSLKLKTLSLQVLHALHGKK